MEPITIHFETDLPEAVLPADSEKTAAGGDAELALWQQWFDFVEETAARVTELAQSAQRTAEQLAKVRADQENLIRQVQQQQEILGSLLEPPSRRRAQILPRTRP